MSSKVAPEELTSTSSNGAAAVAPTDGGRRAPDDAGNASSQAGESKEGASAGREGRQSNGSNPGPARGDTRRPSSERRPSFSMLQKSVRSRRSSQMLVEITAGMNASPDDTNIMGLKPKNMLLRSKSKARNSAAEKTTRQLICDVLRRFWAHWLYENLYALFPLVTALLPVVVGGALAKELVESIPFLVKDGRYDEYTEMTEYHTDLARVLTYMQAVATPIGLYGMPSALICTLWSWKVLLRPVLLKLMLPGFLLSCAIGIVNVSMLYNGSTRLEEHIFFVNVALLVVFLGAAMVRCGHVVKNPLFGWLAVPVLIVALAVCAVYNSQFARLLTQENSIKALFVAVINPLIWEIIITTLRFVARSHRHNHPLTSCMTVAIAMTLKKMYGRYVAATIDETRWVLFCSVFLGISEFVSVTTLTRRDKFVYKRCGSMGKAFLGANEKLDPLAQMKNPRNRELRVHNSVMETSLEIVFAWTGVVMVIWYNVSADATKAVNVMTVVANGCVQYVIECLVDLSVILHLTVVQKEPYLDYANSRFIGWSFSTGMLTFFASGYVVATTLPRLLCRLPGWHESTWVYCDENFKDAEQTYLASLANHTLGST